MDVVSPVAITAVEHYHSGIPQGRAEPRKAVNAVGGGSVQTASPDPQSFPRCSVMSKKVIVETRKLTKIYRDFWGRQKKTALRALNLQIYRGEIFGLLGPNGSGKTTTIKLLLGLLFPTDGDALVFGQPASDVRKNERIGYLPEESYLYKFLNAEETLDFYGRLFNKPNLTASGERHRRAQELIEMVGLKADRKRILKEYSKGMRQRI